MKVNILIHRLSLRIKLENKYTVIRITIYLINRNAQNYFSCGYHYCSMLTVTNSLDSLVRKRLFERVTFGC